jgi:IclR family acetate operon transcriptional repressor
MRVLAPERPPDRQLRRPVTIGAVDGRGRPGDEGPSERYQPWHGLARAGLYRSRVTTSSGGRDNSVHSVDRAISVLQVLARLGSAGVTEISTELDVHKSTVSRLLGTLEARGLVEQNSSRGHYRLGYGIVQLAVGATKKYDLPVVSRPISHVLAEVVGETVNVAVMDGHSVVSIDQVIGSATMTTVNWVGQRTPLHATSAGKVFLAHASPAELAAVLAEGLERFTAQTITDPEALSRQLDEVRLAGYAYSIEEHEVGLAAVAAPIRDLDGDIIAAITVSGPNFRVNEATIPRIARHVLSAAADISQRAGHPKSG